MMFSFLFSKKRKQIVRTDQLVINFAKPKKKKKEQNHLRKYFRQQETNLLIQIRK